jgi:hypothetical protein
MITQSETDRGLFKKERMASRGLADTGFTPVDGHYAKQRYNLDAKVLI